MKVSLKWLERYVECGLSPEELAEAMTMAGVEVSTLERSGQGSSDTVLHLDLTPNRADCLSHIGVAREVSALTGAPVALPSPNLSGEPPAAETYTRIDIEDEEACRRYVGRIIRDVAIGPSPDWLQEALESVGLRPINNVVDVTNFVLMEWGQPLHAFDYDTLAEGRIVVRRARAGEEIVTIDGERRELEPSMLVIADAESPVAVAGVMGGQATEVTERTTTVLLESAYFDPVTVRRCARRLKLPTESSHRFERGVDPEAVELASLRAAALIAEVSGGKVAEGSVDVHPRPVTRPTVTIRVSRTNALLGTRLTAEEVAGYLKRLGLKPVEPEDAELLAFRIPPHRGDLEREVDLIEEVARLHGFEKVSANLPASHSVGSTEPESLVWARKVRRALAACGLSETVSYSFISSEDLDRCRLGGSHALARTIPLLNPLSAEMAVMRTTLLPSLLRASALNAARRVELYRAFEVSKVFSPAKGETGADEPLRVSGVLMGIGEESLWSEAEEADFFEAKGIVESLCEALRVRVDEWRSADHPTFHPLRSAEPVSGGASLGVVGEVRPEVLKAFGLAGPVVAFELDAGALRAAEAPEVSYRSLPRYPAILRDIAVTVEESTPAAAVERIVRASGGPWLEDCTLFDVYSGPPIPKGKKSLAFSLTYRAEDRTLTDQEASEAHEAIVARLEEALGASLRT